MLIHPSKELIDGLNERHSTEVYENFDRDLDFYKDDVQLMEHENKNLTELKNLVFTSIRAAKAHLSRITNARYYQLVQIKGTDNWRVEPQKAYKNIDKFLNGLTDCR